ncbi:beta-lactamase/transpeptidase-like protein [Microthyrium microscopicum]|uniref:Beta-lactamase/transpeptidase-like protein n=1 Tax=Microthyrium microscopicum TaxID=703497 RepID=A0A6A6UPK5_9PEZI|nr:beta-lactamase/transpeptidase-like protein [Microthyrium microscopicum]
MSDPLVSRPANRDQASDRFFSAYDQLIHDTINYHHVPAVSVAVIDGDSTWLKAYGMAQVADELVQAEKVNTETLFNAGSMTKVFISAAISLLVDDDSFPEVQWSTPVSQLLRDDFVLSDSHATQVVTIEDILSHRSGLADQDDAFMGVHAKKPDTLKSVTRKLRYLPLAVPPRTKFLYCNAMYAVATYLIETLTNMPIRDFLRQRIWTPLGMKNTYFGLDDVIEHQLLNKVAKGYGWDNDKSSCFEVDHPRQPEAAGAGEMITTTGDYALFLRCMLQRTGPISAAGHEELVKPRMITDQDPNPFWSHQLYSMGLEIENYHGEQVIGHTGSTTGFACQMVFLPRKNWGFVIMGNTHVDVMGKTKIRWTLIDDLLEVPASKRFDWNAYAARLEKELEAATIEDLYPNLPDSRLPLTVPLTDYTGSYWHAGYEELTVDLESGRLEVDASDRCWRFKLLLEHISGQYFVAKKVDIDTREEDLLKAEFRIDSSGSVGQLGIAFVADSKDEIIWFDKIDS